MVVSFVGEFFGQLATDIVRDGIVEGIKKLFRHRQPKPLRVDRVKVLTRRKKDRLNRRRAR